MKIRELITRLFARKYIDLAQINSFKRAGFCPFFFLNKSKRGNKIIEIRKISWQGFIIWSVIAIGGAIYLLLR